jgi:hypothetical protein
LPRLPGALLLMLSALVAAADIDPLTTVEKSAEKWVDLRTETSRLESDWAAQKPLLESLVQALHSRIQTLETRRDFLAAKTARDVEELAALESSNRTGFAATQAADSRIQAVSARLLQLRPFLPPRLSAALEMAYRSLARPDATLNERMQSATTILNRCVQFNRDVTSVQEALTLPGESGERIYDVIYWGLAQGYAVDRGTGRAWVGRPGAQGWTWAAQPDATAAIAAVLAIQQDKADPRFVPLPARVNTAPAAR